MLFRSPQAGPAADLESAIQAAPDLSERQKQALVEIYRSFRAGDGEGAR